MTQHGSSLRLHEVPETGGLQVPALSTSAASIAQENPFLVQGSIIPFDQMGEDSWHHIPVATERLCQEAAQSISLISLRATPRTFEDTVLAIYASIKPLEDFCSTIRHLKSVVATRVLEDYVNAADEKASSLLSSIWISPELAEAVEQFAASSAASSLTTIQSRLLTVTLERFRAEGAFLDREPRARIHEINERLTSLGNQFLDNLKRSTAQFEHLITDSGDLDGLPQSALDAARRRAEERGLSGWLLTLESACVEAVSAHCTVAAVRELLSRAHSRRASSGESDNAPVVQEILVLRAEKARLLGFDSYAELITARRMAKDSSTVASFLGDLSERVRKFAADEMQSLLTFRRELEGPDAPELRPWDVPFYADKQRRVAYSFDAEQLRNYFPTGRVLEGIFGVCNALFGITATRTIDIPTWHPEVLVFEVRNSVGVTIAYLHLDIHVREGAQMGQKNEGAWMEVLRSGGPMEGVYIPHVVAVGGNFTRGLTRDDALLSHDNVSTLFHEMGHALHQIMSEVPIPPLAGVQVPWDFIEFPSQLFEFWAWLPEVLNTFAAHHETGERIPAALMEQMLRSRNFGNGPFYFRQLALATTDLLLHSSYDPCGSEGAVDFSRKVARRFSFVEIPDDSATLLGFHHIFEGADGGYAAAYYSYLWGEVHSACAAEQFKGRWLDRTMGARLINSILSKGNSADPIALFEEFTGKPFSLNGWLAVRGLVND